MSTTTPVSTGWQSRRLDEICTVIFGSSPPGTSYNTSGDGLPFFQGKAEFGDISPTPVKWCNKPTKVAEAGDVLLSVRAPVGPTNVCVTRSCIGRGLAALRPAAGVPSRYLLYAIRATAHALAAKSTGSTFEAVGSAVVKAHEIPLAPPSERQAIVAGVEGSFTRLDAGVAGLERVRANLKRYRAAVLKAACEGTLVPTEADLARAEGRDYETGDQLLERILTARRENWTGKGKHKTPAPTETAGLPSLPEGWTWSSIGECFRVEVGATPSRKSPEYWNGSIPWVSSGEVRFRPVGSTRESITSAGLDNSSTQLNPSGSVLLAMIGEGKTRGQVGWLTIDACNNQNCSAIWVPETPVPTMFVVAWLWSRYDETRRDSSGNNQPALNKSRVEALPFPMPPLAEQHRIVAEVERRLSVIDELEALVETNLARAGRLRQSILAKAFSGELVPASGDGAASPPPRKKKGPLSGGPEGRPTAGKGPVQSSASR